MTELLLIFWDIRYFDGWRTIDTLRYLIFRWLTYCWYFEILNISMVDVLLILLYNKYLDGWRTVDTLRYLVFRWLTYYWYFDIINISIVDVLLILWYTKCHGGMYGSSRVVRWWHFVWSGIGNPDHARCRRGLQGVILGGPMVKILRNFCMMKVLRTFSWPVFNDDVIESPFLGYITFFG